MKRNRLIITTTVGLLVIFSSLLFVFQVQQSKVAVVTTFGKVSRDVTEPGMHFKLPWPIQDVHVLDQRIQNFESIYEEVRLPDQYTLLMQVYVGWAIEKPGVFFPKFSNGANDSVAEAEKRLGDLVRNAKNEVAGKHPFVDFISADENKMKFVQIENEILQKVQDQVKANDYGVSIKFLQIKRIGLPESVTAKVFERMQSERQVRISKIQGEGEEEATKIKSSADREAQTLLSDAEATAIQIRGEGEVAANKSLAVLQQNPQLAIFNMKLAALEQLLKGEKTTLVLNPKFSPLDLLNNTQPIPRTEPKDMAVKP